jgi:DNA-binding NarL/FixJ family response regulator
LLADDHAMLVEGLRRLLQPEFDFVGAVGDGRALLEAVERLKPDVIVVDVSMPLLNGIEAVRRLKKVNSGPKVVFLSMHGDVEVATEALRAGASGYVLKHSASETLCHAIWEALEGRLYVSPRIARDVMAAVIESSQRKGMLAVRLTQREREVLQLVAEGRTIRGISAILEIAARTVVFHKSSIMDKLGLRTTAELTQYAVKSGVISIQMSGSDGVIENEPSSCVQSDGCGKRSAGPLHPARLSRRGQGIELAARADRPAGLEDTPLRAESRRARWPLVAACGEAGEMTNQSTTERPARPRR